MFNNEANRPKLFCPGEGCIGEMLYLMKISPSQKVQFVQQYVKLEDGAQDALAQAALNLDNEQQAIA